jgi:prepilin-type N-terminal cleavage/methylation domain-containing protein
MMMILPAKPSFFNSLHQGVNSIVDMNIRKRGFTLIELLIVIAIIALLAAILFPVFARARENARRTSCLSNLRQLGIGMQQYVQDYDGTYPYIPKGNLADTGRAPMGTGDFSDAYQDTPEANRWDSGPIITRLQPYIKSEQLSFCPSSDKVNPDMSANTNYEGNAYLFADTSKEVSSPFFQSPIRESVFQVPSNIMLFQDYKGSNARPHLDGNNNLAADGRVKWMKSGNSAIKPNYWRSVD